MSWDTVADIQAVESPRVDKNTTPCLDEATAKKLLHAPDPTTLGGVRDHALLFTFFVTACRSQALALARVGDVEMVGQEYELVVTEKGNRRARKVLLEAVAPLRRYISAADITDDADGPLFRPLAKTRDAFERRHLSGRAILKIVKKYARAVGLSNVDVTGLGRRGICTHSLRKTALNNALGHGAPIHEVQALAGHSDIRTTQSYINYQESDSRSAARHIQIR